MDHKNEIDLDLCIGKIARRDRFALEELYREYARPVYRFSLMTLQDPSLAEDAMQDTFLRIMAYSGTYKMGTNARAWIFAIAKNACTDITKKRIPTADDETMRQIGDDTVIEDAVDKAVISGAMAKLTTVEREVLSLYIYSGLKQTEIAKVMGMSYIKVRSHYKYAIEKLRKELMGK
ncbi:MAG: sigma-70 family RNA polymerase sigma factor [Ruminococcaceae bacterium]|nr:sigma-70 family RNA polymerase sigma factor [Oscillospiraceae bacterium]